MVILHGASKIGVLANSLPKSSTILYACDLSKKINNVSKYAIWAHNYTQKANNNDPLKQLSRKETEKRVNPRKTAFNTSPTDFSSNISLDSKFQAFKNSNADKVESSSPGKEDFSLSTVAKSMTCTDAVTSDSSLSSGSKIPFEVAYVKKDPAAKTKKSLEITSISTQSDLKKMCNAYLQLSKPRLTVLVMLSAICSYALSPLAASLPQLVALTVGTTLCSSSANAINMGREPEFDRRMVRTQARPVVRGLISSNQAYYFASVAGIMGVTILYAGVNPTVALLGASNIVLYAWIYTSLKRKHILNTWVGAVVGALPPLMGWAAASPLSDPGAWCLAGLLYAWQFPHFNTLSHNIKGEYKNAGYVMTAWKNPKLNARVSLRYSLLMIPLCFGLSYFDVTDWYYQIDSGIANIWLSYWAFKFWWQQRINYSTKVLKNSAKFNEGILKANIFARKTFWVSVLQLPAILILAILHKKGRWDELFKSKEDTIDKVEIEEEMEGK